jgi:hypothetical protein
MTQLRNRLAVLTVVLAAFAAFIITGCSKDNGIGPDSSGPATPVDEIVVNLTNISVKYDCDSDPLGVTQPGEFHYWMAVDTLSEEGKWVDAMSTGDLSSDLNSGESRDIYNQKAIFRLERTENKQFRVRVGMREADPGENDFNSSKSTVHIYGKTRPQMWGPENGTFSSYNSATQIGTMKWTKNERDQTWAFGVLITEGCQATLTYTVQSREI